MQQGLALQRQATIDPLASSAPTATTVPATVSGAVYVGVAQAQQPGVGVGVGVQPVGGPVLLPLTALQPLSAASVAAWKLIDQLEMRREAAAVTLLYGQQLVAMQMAMQQPVGVTPHPQMQTVPMVAVQGMPPQGMAVQGMPPQGMQMHTIAQGVAPTQQHMQPLQPQQPLPGQTMQSGHVSAEAAYEAAAAAAAAASHSGGYPPPAGATTFASAPPMYTAASAPPSASMQAPAPPSYDDAATEGDVFFKK
jgi:hypothetical protein